MKKLILVMVFLKSSLGIFCFNRGRYEEATNMQTVYAKY